MTDKELQEAVMETRERYAKREYDDLHANSNLNPTDWVHEKITEWDKHIIELARMIPYQEHYKLSTLVAMAQSVEGKEKIRHLQHSYEHYEEY